ncbi:MAG: AmmeMemoRadiSam system radical SAM enzyme, partial [Candidatus Heimdallarchaeota archaeon]
VGKLIEARDMALEAGIHYVYLGNVRDANHSNTFCKNCGEELINRSGYTTRLKNLTESMQCKNCGTQADIIS